METHKQFQGGLKTVDTDDSLDSFYLRDAENVSLSEFGYLERRYGLVEDYKFDFLALQQAQNATSSKYRLQGYFEYLRRDGKKDIIIFFNGFLYLNGVQVNKLYKYPEDLYGPSISDDKFDTYINEEFSNNDYQSLTDIRNLFLTNREMEATRIEDRLFIFTGVYPIVYEGTGEFYLMPEYRPSFALLRAASHDLHTKDLTTAYAEGIEAGDIAIDPDTNITLPSFGEPGYAPILPYNNTNGSGFMIKTKFTLPSGPLYTNPFTGFSAGNTWNVGQRYVDGVINYTNQDGLYLELVPEIYYRDSGLSAPDIGWTKIDDAVLEYNTKSNLPTANRDSSLFTIYVPSGLAGGEVPFAEGINIARALESVPFTTTANQSFDITINNVPIGYNDYLVILNFKKYGYEDRNVENTLPSFISETVYSYNFTLQNVFGSINPVEDYKEFDPKSLWSCNRVLNHYGKLMAYGSTLTPQRLFIGHPIFKNYFPAYFTLDFETDDEQLIQKITPFMNILVVQSENYTWGVKGIDALIESENTYTPFTISPIYGTIAPKSVRPVRNQLYFLSSEGIVSLQSLYAIDDQYNVKRMDENIENIVPKDPEAVAIQYDNQYWINFPNTDNNLTLRYDVDLRAWVKDTYFDYNGLDNNNQPKLSETIFNGVFRYIREGENLAIVTNPMQLGAVDKNPFGANNFKVYRLYIDYSIPTDLGEVPRTLFETSFLNQGYPFHTKKYLEEKMEFAIQNEYNTGIEPILIDRPINTEEVSDLNIYEAPKVDVLKNHEYKVSVLDFANEVIDIDKIQVALFDIQGNPILNEGGDPIVLIYEDQKIEKPSIFNLQVTDQNVLLRIYNPNSFQIRVKYALNDGTVYQNPTRNYASESFGPINPFTSIELQLTEVPPGYHKFSVQSTSNDVDSDAQIIYFYVPDGVYDEGETGVTPVLSIAPNNLRGVIQTDSYFDPVIDENRTFADGFELVWNDSNLDDEGLTSTAFRLQYRNVTNNGAWITEPLINTLPTEANPYVFSFTEQQVIDFENDQFAFRVSALFKGIESAYTAEFLIRLTAPSNAPDEIQLVNWNDLPTDPDLIHFYFTDIDGEDYYRVYWRYITENYTTKEQFIPSSNRVFVVDGELSGTVRFYLEAVDPGEESSTAYKDIISNAVVEAIVIPINSINQDTFSLDDGYRIQAVRRRAYDHTQLTTQAVNGVSGIQVTNPAAKKTSPHGPTSGPAVFESYWDFTFGETSSEANRLWDLYDSNLLVQANEPATPTSQDWAEDLGNGEYNIYEYNSLTQEWELYGMRVLPESQKEIAILTGLTPSTNYYLRIRGVYDVEGTFQDRLTQGFWSPTFTATSGNQTLTVAETPVYVGDNPTPGNISVSLRNKQGPSADIYWKIRTDNAAIDVNNSATYDGIVQNVNDETVFSFNKNTNEQTTYYIKAVAKTNLTNASLPFELTRTTSAFCTAGDTGNTRCPLGYGVSPYTLEKEQRTGVWNGSSCVTEWVVVQNYSTTCGYVPLQTYTATYYWDQPNDQSSINVIYQISQVQEGAQPPNPNPGGSFGYWSPDPSTISMSQNVDFYGLEAPLAVPSSPPSSVTASSTNNNNLSASWTSVSGATYYSYQIYIDGSLFISGTTSSTSFSQTISAGSVYARVRACNSSGCSVNYKQSNTIIVSGVVLG